MYLPISFKVASLAFCTYDYTSAIEVTLKDNGQINS